VFAEAIVVGENLHHRLGLRRIEQAHGPASEHPAITLQI
jgi:hypothetical protein